MITLYSGTSDPFSHRCRIVLYEKQADFKVVDLDLVNNPADFDIIRPHKHVPLLVERDLVLHLPNVINEYIDDRYPQPPLLATDPVTRARTRQLLFSIETELYSFVEVLEQKGKTADKAREHIRDRLVEVAAQFSKQKYMLGNEFAMPDVAMAPLLWRLDYYGIEIPKPAAPLMAYAKTIFERKGFIDSLTPTEKMMRR
jgi:stringent starvation protein A